MAASNKPLIVKEFSFLRQNRLISEQDFAYVFAKPIKITQQNFLALCRTNDLGYVRLGIIIKKHLVKQAVKRVAMRRIIRESFRHHKDLLKGLDIIVLLRSECTPLDKVKLREMVDKLWPAIGAKLHAQ